MTYADTLNVVMPAPATHSASMASDELKEPTQSTSMASEAAQSQLQQSATATAALPTLQSPVSSVSAVTPNLQRMRMANMTDQREGSKADADMGAAASKRKEEIEAKMDDDEMRREAEPIAQRVATTWALACVT
jgi:hypothetical protein